MAVVSERLADVWARIGAACRSVGREPKDVCLVAVSKNQPVSAMLEAYEAGQRDFGESRWQELRDKVALMPSDVTWHFVGKLQTNKARAVAEAGCVVHALESVGQLEVFARQPRVVPAFIEVNVAEEPKKSGVLLTTLDDYARLVSQCERVDCVGLMTIGPTHATPEQSRLVYRRLAEEALRRGLRKLSMGMSSDYVEAVQEGATHVRVGSAMFGARL